MLSRHSLRVARLACWLLGVLCLMAQADQLITLKETGPRDKRINILFLGDGYVAGQEGKFLDDVRRFVPAILDGPYGDNYQNNFNIYAWFTASAQQGATDEIVGVPKNTYYECRYQKAVRRLLTCDFTKMYAEQAAALPDSDSVFMLVNANTFGGSGGAVSVVSQSALEVAAHEFAHTFAKLADEYTPSSALTGNANFNPLVSARNKIKWAHWIQDTTPVPTPGDSGRVGAYLTRWNEGDGYRPTYKSRMRVSSASLGPVNTEQFILKMYERVSPLDDFSPHEDAPVNWVGAGQLSVTPKTSTRGLKVEWFIDGHKTSETGRAFNGTALRAGRSSVTARVFDDTPMVRLDAAHLLEDSHTWQVDNHLVDALPQARISGVDRATLGEPVTLDAAASGGTGLGYLWTAPGFEPTQSTAANPTFIARQIQAGILHLTVTDASGNTSSTDHPLTVFPTPQQAATALDSWAATYLGRQPDPGVTRQMKSELNDLMGVGGYSLPVRRIGIKRLCLIQKRPDNGDALTLSTECARSDAAQWVLDGNHHLRNTLTGRCMSNPGRDLVALTLVPCTAGENRWEAHEGLYLNGEGTDMGLGERGNNLPYVMRGTGTHRQIVDGITVQDDPILTLARPESLLLAWRVSAWHGDEPLPDTQISGAPVVLTGAAFTLAATTESSNPLTYAWRAPGFTPSTSSDPSPVFTGTAPGTHRVTLTVADNEGRSATAERAIDVVGPDHPPVGQLGTDADAGAVGGILSTITAEVSSPGGLPLTYAWHLPPELREAVISPPNPPGTLSFSSTSVTVETPVVLRVTVTDSRNQALELSRTIILYPHSVYPEARITGPTRVAPGAAFTLSTASSTGQGLSYVWYAPGFTPGNPVDVAPRFIAPANPGRYTLTVDVTNADENTTRASQTVEVTGQEYGPPTGTLDGVETLVAGEQATFTANVASPSNSPLSYRWERPEQLAGGSLVDRTVTWQTAAVAVDTQVVVALTVTDADGQSLSLSKPVLIKAAQPGPEARITGPDTVPVGGVVSVSAAQSTGTGLTLAWRTPAFTPSSATTVAASFVAPSVPGAQYITLEVTDNQHRVASAGHSIMVTAAQGDDCATPWVQTKAYAVVNEKVSYDYYNYEVAHWTQNQRPDLNWVISGSSKPWRRLDRCGPTAH